MTPPSPFARQSSMRAAIAASHDARSASVSGRPARIFSMADQYDALRSTRPYKRGFSHAETVRILVEGDGRTMPGHFDPLILEAFRKAEPELLGIWDSYEG